MYFYDNEIIRLNGRIFKVRLVLIPKNIEEGKYYGNVNITASVSEIDALDNCKVSLFGEATTSNPVEFKNSEYHPVDAANLYMAAVEQGIIEKAKEDLINKIQFIHKALKFDESTHTELNKIVDKLKRPVCF